MLYGTGGFRWLHDALQNALGAAVLEQLDAEGRYCRDVY